MVNQVLNEAEKKMDKTLQDLKADLARVRTGRAAPSLIEDTPVEAYGSLMNLRDLATISAPEPRLLTVQPWDAGNTPQILKAIQQAGFGLNPIKEGDFIRIPLPPLTEERRKEMVKLVRGKIEEHRIAARQIRREAVEKINQLEKNDDISEDEKRRGEEKVQVLTDKVVKEMEEISKSKEKELAEL
jgi:ribosome recycling factor